MCRLPFRRRFIAAVLLAMPMCLPARAGDEPTGRQVLERAENLLWARTLQGRYEMQIVTPRWQRTLALRVWMDRPKRTFIRIDAPAKEAGIGSLRIGNEMWNYLPGVNTRPSWRSGMPMRCSLRCGLRQRSPARRRACRRRRWSAARQSRRASWCWASILRPSGKSPSSTAPSSKAAPSPPAPTARS